MDKPQINHAELREERDYLERLIKAAGSWGAAVSVMQERVDGINRTLAGHVKKAGLYRIVTTHKELKGK